MHSRAKRGFTMIEIAITIAIIVIVSVVVYANFNDINNTGEVIAAADKVRNNIRIAQTFTLSGKSFKNKLPVGWGLNFNRSTGYYTIFGDLDGDKRYSYPTKILIHGDESMLDAGHFKESSTSTKTVTLGDGSNAVWFPTKDASSGMPTGTSNGCWAFDGSQDYMQIAYDNDINFAAQDFTIDFWMKIGGLGNKQYILGQSTGFNFSYEADGSLHYWFRDSNAVEYNLYTAANTLTDTNWHYIAISRQGKFIYLSLDAVNKGIMNLTDASTAMFNSSSALIIGQYNSSNYFGGKLDEVRVVKGWGQWNDSVVLPTAYYQTDEEQFRRDKLPVGLVFQRLYSNAVATATLDLYFSPNTYTVSTNGDAPSDTIKYIINRRGMENIASSGDSPQTFIILPSGVVSSTAP